MVEIVGVFVAAGDGENAGAQDVIPNFRTFALPRR
jgi:hypothetical protein